MIDDEQWQKEGAPLFAEARQLDGEAPAPAALARARAGLRERVEAHRRFGLAPRLAVAAAAFSVLAVAAVLWKRGDPALEREISTGATATLITLSPTARAQLLPLSRARVLAADQLALLNGRVQLEVGSSPLTVRAAAMTLEVAEAKLEVACFGDEVQVMVSEGVVRAARGDERWEVKAGETWPAPPQPPAALEAPKPSATQLSKLEQAAVFSQQGKVDAARALYIELAKEDGSIAELALYYRARLESQRARRPQLALELLDEQLLRFPDGPLAPEAKLSRLEALQALDAGR